MTKPFRSANQLYPLFEPFFVFTWWYSHGLVGVLQWMRGNMKQAERDIGLFVWIKALFVPMYGQWDWRGRAISFCFRVLVIIWKALREAILIIWYIGLLGLYCTVPLLAVFWIVQGIQVFLSLQ